MISYRMEKLIHQNQQRLICSIYTDHVFHCQDVLYLSPLNSSFALKDLN